MCGRELTSFSLTGVCGPCWQELEPWPGPACSNCGLPFGSDVAREGAEQRCAQCLADEFTFDRARSFGLYRDGLRALILQLKFQRRERLGTKLGELLGTMWESLMTEMDAGRTVIVPVPLHASRVRERGFNQAALLAEGLSHDLVRRRGVAGVDARALLRIRPTRPQTGLSISARRENVRGAFSVADPHSVRGRTVVLVDDVMTTGSTLSSCATVLKAAGARCVMALTLARATPQFPDVHGAAGLAAVDDFARAQP